MSLGGAYRPMVESSRKGLLCAIAAFGMYGLYPLYFKAVGEASAFEILCHRVIWSVPFAALLITVTRGWPSLRQSLRDRHLLKMLGLTSFLIAVNWLIFIYSIVSGQVLLASLAYYINPLLNVLIGMAFLRERLTRRQGAAVILAALGTIYLAIRVGQVPWISLGMALSFGLYGFFRKTVRIEPLNGLFIEVLAITPPALAYMIYLGAVGEMSLGFGGVKLTLLLIAAGVVNVVPLLAFINGARLLPLSTLGLFQYIGPTCMFFLSVFLYREPFTRTHLITFILIWSGLILFVSDSRRARR